MKFISRLYTHLSVVSWWSSAGPGGGVGAALNSVFHLLANRMDLQRRNRLTHWLPSGQSHAGPFTAGSADTTLWSSLRKSRRDNEFNTRLLWDHSYTHTAAAAHRDQEPELCHLGRTVHCACCITHFGCAVASSTPGPFGSSAVGRHFSLKWDQQNQLITCAEHIYWIISAVT